MDQTSKRVFVRLLSDPWFIQLPTVGEQSKEEGLKCLGFGVTFPLRYGMVGTLNQRVRSSSLRRPTIQPSSKRARDASFRPFNRPWLSCPR
jgi:hypothetical protein